ncbi:MAG: YceI family protein, partial [Chloroflexi bacterium]|nr:YceI family protein [Chloroflexota bacterium]
MNKTTQPLIWINRFLIVIISIATGLNPLPHALAHDAPPNAKGVRVTAPPPPSLAITGDGQSLYHIDAAQSTAQYKVKEKFVGGIEGSTVVGSSSGITGTLLIDTKMPANSTVGMVTVNVEQLTTDSKQRDSRLRAAYLESSLFPLATFIPEAKQTLPQTFQMGVPFSFVLHGYLTIHNVTIQSDWTITLTITDNAVTGTAITQVPMSDFGVGPISIVGLLSTEDNVTLTLNFVANKEGTKAQAAPKAATTPTANANIDFARQVKPIFEAKCVGCHMVGEIGHSVYAMDTLKDVVQVANDLPIILGSGYMPPWSPSHQAPAFKDNRSLSK